MNLNLNTTKVKELSTDVSSIKESLTKVISTQESSVTEIQKLTDKIATNSKLSADNAAQIAVLQSALDSIGTDNSLPLVSRNSHTSELLISGIPDQVITNSSSAEIVHQIFEKLTISNLENDILSIRTLHRKRKPSGSVLSQVSHSFILQMKSTQVRDHIVEVKRRSNKLFAKNIFNIQTENQIFINEFLHADTFKLLNLAKAKVRAVKYKYAWVHKSTIYVKKDDDSEKIQIRSEYDLDKLE
ncbi:uncharacterized protein LOC141528412 [Cotesia typhae]|uniref:uncharacterized protein LOC141528412 n=1 Tax=Cotesia typhae TaxID=2053667 RepID=UPI003D692477